MTTNITKFKEKLIAEKNLLTKELSTVGRINPENTTDWEPVAADLNLETAEAEERAGEIASFEERSAIEFELEKRLNDVDEALLRCSNGTYGLCAICNEAIEEARLDANPSATTCRAHMD